MERLLASSCVVVLLGCASHGERYEAPPEGGPAIRPSVPSGAHDEATLDAVIDQRPLDAEEEAELLISVKTTLARFLGATHAVVEDTDAQIVAGADQESQSLEPSEESELSLRLPAGSGYTIKLSATTSDTHPTTCRATVGPLSVLAGSTARVQVFAWDCGEQVGYVPAALENDCYWLVDWAFVGRTSAAVGELIQSGVAGSSAARYRWSSPSPELGGFTTPEAAETDFRCEAAGEGLALEVALSDADCEQRVIQTISCF